MKFIYTNKMSLVKVIYETLEIDNKIYITDGSIEQMTREVLEHVKDIEYYIICGKIFKTIVHLKYNIILRTFDSSTAKAVYCIANNLLDVPPHKQNLISPYVVNIPEHFDFISIADSFPIDANYTFKTNNTVASVRHGDVVMPCISFLTEYFLVDHHRYEYAVRLPVMENIIRGRPNNNIKYSGLLFIPDWMNINVISTNPPNCIYRKYTDIHDEHYFKRIHSECVNANPMMFALVTEDEYIVYDIHNDKKYKRMTLSIPALENGVLWSDPKPSYWYIYYSEDEYRNLLPDNDEYKYMKCDDHEEDILKRYDSKSCYVILEENGCVLINRVEQQEIKVGFQDCQLILVNIELGNDDWEMMRREYLEHGIFSF